MSRKKSFFVLILVVLATSGFSPEGQRYFEMARQLDLFANVFKEVNKMYVDDVNPNTLVRTGIDGMLNSLDPYTNYIPEDEVENFRTQNTGEYGGIGAATRQFGKRVVVSMIFDGYPAAKGGLKIGDEVIRMDGKELSKLSFEESEMLMRGAIGKPVKLTVRRPGTPNLLELQFNREKIRVSSVPYSGMVSESVGYVQLSEFTVRCSDEVKKAVTALKDKGAKQIVLDLRGNPGGILQEAVAVCGIFIPKGKHVVSTKGKTADNNLDYETTHAAVDLDIPVAVLIDRGSASASEIVAGTLQDYDRAVIIGEKSFGKGLVQVSKPITYNSLVKITTAKYYTPSGRCIQVLDYSHRRNDGSVGAIPDSVKKPFKTTRGRVVFDGGGVDPDVTLANSEMPEIGRVLWQNGYFFDYATEYVLSHSSIPAPKNFNLTEPEFSQFVAWVKKKEYSYRTQLEVTLEKLTAQAKKENLLAELKPQIDLVTQKLTESRKNDLMAHKERIKTTLETEIAIRYYNEIGATESRFKSDAELKMAIRVLTNPSEYKKILKL